MMLQKAYRLAQKTDFNKVYRHGKSTANRHFVLYVLPNQKVEHFRLGISVSKKVGGAVVRNRVKRLIKEIVRLQLAPRIAPHHDLVIVVRKAALDLDFHEMSKSLAHVFNRGKILLKTDKSFSRQDRF